MSVKKLSWTTSPIAAAVTAFMLATGGAEAVAATLELHLPFDVDGSDISGNNRDAALVGGAAISGGSLGVSGEALTLDGIDDFAQVTGYKGIGGDDARSVSLWVNTTVNQANGTFFAGWGDTGLGSKVRYDLGLQSGTTDQLRNELNAGAAVSSTGGGSIIDGQWHHVVFSYDGAGTASFYLDGSPYGTEAEGSINTTLTEDVVIGTGIRQAFAANTTARWTDGLIDDVQIYSGELSVSEVSSLFQNPGTAIPEPSALLLAGLGLAVCGLSRKRSTSL